MGAGLLFRCMQVNRGGFPIGAWEKSGCQFAGTRSAPPFRGICFGGLLSHVYFYIWFAAEPPFVAFASAACFHAFMILLPMLLSPTFVAFVSVALTRS